MFFAALEKTCAIVHRYASADVVGLDVAMRPLLDLMLEKLTPRSEIEAREVIINSIVILVIQLES